MNAAAELERLIAEATDPERKGPSVYASDRVRLLVAEIVRLRIEAATVRIALNSLPESLRRTLRDAD